MQGLEDLDLDLLVAERVVESAGASLTSSSAEPLSGAGGLGPEDVMDHSTAEGPTDIDTMQDAALGGMELPEEGDASNNMTAEIAKNMQNTSNDSAYDTTVRLMAIKHLKEYLSRAHVALRGSDAPGSKSIMILRVFFDPEPRFELVAPLDLSISMVGRIVWPCSATSCTGEPMVVGIDLGQLCRAITHLSSKHEEIVITRRNAEDNFLEVTGAGDMDDAAVAIILRIDLLEARDGSSHEEDVVEASDLLDSYGSRPYTMGVGVKPQQDPMTDFVKFCAQDVKDMAFILGYVPKDKVPASARSDADMEGYKRSQDQDLAMLVLQGVGDASTTSNRLITLSHMFTSAKGNPFCYVVQQALRGLSAEEQGRLVDRHGVQTLRYVVSMKALLPFMQLAQVMGGRFHFATETQPKSIREPVKEATEIVFKVGIRTSTDHSQHGSVIFACFRQG